MTDVKKKKKSKKNKTTSQGDDEYPWRGRSIRKFREYNNYESEYVNNSFQGDEDDLHLDVICVPGSSTGRPETTTTSNTHVDGDTPDDPFFETVPDRGKSIKKHRASTALKQREDILRLQSVKSNEGFEGEGVHINYDSFAGVEEVELERLKPTTPDNLEEDENFEANITRNLPSRKLKSRRGTGTPSLRSQASVRPEDEGYEFISSADVVDHAPLESVPTRRGSARDTMKSRENVRRMTMSLDRKRDEMNTVKMRAKPSGGRKARPISNWVEIKFSVSMKARRVFQNMKLALSSIHLWQGHMKRVQGVFGTGVLSYFVFLRWLLYLNLFIAVLLISFLLIPQIIKERSYQHNPQNFTGLELLTGEGWFTHSELYYGQYTNTKINNEYNMQLAYLLVGSGYILICLAVLVVSIGKSYKENYIIGGESFTRFCSKVFCAWDYTISNQDTAALKEQSIYRDILETVGPHKSDDEKKLTNTIKLFFLRVLTWFTSLTIMALSIWLIVYVSQTTVEGFLTNTEKHSVRGMLPAITISLVNIFIPPVFRMIVLLEKYESSETAVNVNLFRTIVLQLGSICTYVAHLYIEVRKDSVQSEIKLKQICWETKFGQVFYKLVIIDFIATLLSTFFLEFIRNLLSKYCRCCSQYKPGFDISKNVLNLIYAQGIVWLGTFFSPLLPIINIFKLIIIFYVKRISVTRNCKPSVKPFKASKMDVLFRLLLSLMLVFTCVVLGVVVLAQGHTKPSVNCGPFRNETRIYSVVSKALQDKQIIADWFQKVIDVITSWVVIGAILFVMILLAYYFRLKMKTTEKKIENMKHQMTLASQDKQYLIRQIKEMMKHTTSGGGQPTKEKVT